jgi:hypothetical protein
MNKLPTHSSPASDQPPARGASYAPTRWWQWVLVYPTLAISLLGSIPTLIETVNSVKLGVPWGQSQIAELQNIMWKNNLLCSAAPFKWYTTESNFQVDGTICKSGDVLVRVEAPNKKTGFWWVPVEGVIKEDKMVSLISVANAASDISPIVLADNSEAKVLCQKFVAEGQLLRRIDTGQGCFDEIVNTYTGQVIQRNPVACSNTC